MESVILVLDISIISEVSEFLSCTSFCCVRLTIGDKNFTYGIPGGDANIGIVSGGGLGLTTRSSDRSDGELLQLDESGDISEPSGRVMITP